jgi:mannose-6-phosphate isomerase-like protein (cupin superfamily)
MTAPVDPKSLFRVGSVRPQLLEEGKYGRNLLKGQVLGVGVQVIANGGENNLHHHPGNEAVYFVMNGAAKFYTTHDEPVAELKKNDYLYVPAGAPYWFESSSTENLVLIRVGAQLQQDDRRIDLSPATPNMTPVGGTGAGGRKAVFKDGVFFGD